MKICVIIPTYNNHLTVVDVVERTLPFGYPVIVVNDGSTDDTLSRLYAANSPERFTIVSYDQNQGKGHALRTGFRKAIELGYDYAVTIDSDGQHYPEELPKLIGALQEQLAKGNRKVLIVGNRKLHQDNMPGGNTFANYFSNFWFMLQTWQYLPDTQTGYRIYPLHNLHGLSLLTARYEAELELLVLAAWHGVRLCSVPIKVFYPDPDKRVSHFRPLYDFGRISILNTILCCLCIYGWPMNLINMVKRFLNHIFNG